MRSKAILRGGDVSAYYATCLYIARPALFRYQPGYRPNRGPATAFREQRGRPNSDCELLRLRVHVSLSRFGGSDHRATAATPGYKQP
jgi:hypothetical protein